MKIDALQAAEFFKSRDEYIILTHANPDGDTLGCAYALMRALKKCGRRAKVLCGDKIASKFSYLICPDDEVGEEAAIVAVDVADPKLLGALQNAYEKKIELCIDHHRTNLFYAENTLLDPEAAAACEIIYEVIGEMGVEIDEQIATCIYTGISTDTGCFKYSNVTAKTHIIAAELISLGARHTDVDKIMFDTKSKAQFSLERLCLESMVFFFNDKVALVCLTKDMLEKAGADESCSDAIAAMPRQVEGVLIGVTVKEKDKNVYKISLRTNEPYSAREICGALGGGGHDRAAGCQVSGTLEEAKNKIIETIAEFL